MRRPIAMLGGGFDPVHKGHIHLATEVAEKLTLAEVRFVPYNKLPDKPMPLATPQQRLAMLKLAIENHPRLKIDDRELRTQGLSYTIDTLAQLRAELKDTPLCLLLGMDNFKHLHTWHNWTSLINFAHLVVVNRPGVSDEIETEPLQIFANKYHSNETNTLHQQSAGTIVKLTLPMINISSTQIRQALALGENKQLPTKVLEFIRANHLYG